MKQCSVLLILFMIAFTHNGNSQVSSTSKLHLYLLAGQSNMSGRGELTAESKLEGDSNVLILTKEGTWVTAHNPLHFDKPRSVGVGPGLTFGMAMAAARPGQKIGLVPCAVGGTSINEWRPGGYDSATKTHPYDDAVKRIKMAMKGGVFDGIIWHQGESDSQADSAAVYLPKLIRLIGLLRSETKNKKLPFVAGELGRYRPQYSNISKVLEQLPQEVPHTALVSTDGLTHRGDFTHFNTASAEELGKRYAVKMLELQHK